MVSWLVAAGAAGRWLLVGWLVSRVFLRQGVHTKMLISWQARVLERKCRFRGAGGVGGERVTRAYTVEVQTASVFYAQSLILLLFEP